MDAVQHKQGLGDKFHQVSLSSQQQTSACQKLPRDFKEKLVVFQRYLIKEWLEKGYDLSSMGNADETHGYFDMLVAYMFNDKGVKEVKVRIAGYGKQQMPMPVILCCTATGRKLPEYVVFKC